jgi:acyl carrier protein
MDLNVFEDLVREFLRSVFPVANHAALPGPDDDLFETGLLDSQGFLQLVLHLEDRTGLQINITLAEPEDFSTIRGLFQLAQPVDSAP